MKTLQRKRWSTVNLYRVWAGVLKFPLCSSPSVSLASVFLFFFFHFFFLSICLFIYLWLCWVFVSERGLSLVAASGGLSLSRPLLLQSTGSRRAGSVVVAHGPSCSAACGILPDQGLSPCPLHWQADSQPLRHQESPASVFLNHRLHEVSTWLFLFFVFFFSILS